MKKQYRLIIEELSEEGGHYHPTEVIEFKADGENLGRLVRWIKDRIKPKGGSQEDETT